MPKLLTCSEIWGGAGAVDTDFETPGFAGALFSKPASGPTGGDIYLVSSCNMGQVSKLVLADVAGHGEQIARVGRLLGDLLRDNLAERDNARFLNQLNRQFEADDPGGGRGTVFATLAVATYFTRSQEFCFAYAGHPHIILGRAGQFHPLGLGPAETPDSLGSDGQSEVHADHRRIADAPIGIEPDVEFRQGRLALRRDDWLIFCTDGVYEARNEMDQEYGLPRMLRDLRQLSPCSPMALKNGLLTRLRDFIAPRRLDQDDVTLIVMTLRDIREPPIVRMAPKLERLLRQQQPKR